MITIGKANARYTFLHAIAHVMAKILKKKCVFLGDFFHFINKWKLARHARAPGRSFLAEKLW
jgi:hypothetical protein